MAEKTADKPERNEAAATKVGTVLKNRRRALKLSLAQVELGTRIRGKYLTKIEASDYGDLPNDIYIRGFVSAYADYLGLDSAQLTQQYVTERGGTLENAPVENLKPIKSRRFVFTPSIITVFLLFIFAAAIVGYLSWQFNGLASAPQIQLSSPASDKVIDGGILDVNGNVTQGADVFINDSPVPTDGNGNFSDKLALQDGLNVIHIVAKSKLGKSSEITRNILAHLPKVTASSQPLPSQSFDGVAVNIAVKDQATWLIVTVDGQEVFRGTMLAGTNQSFKGSDHITISTGNAGDTVVSVTNSKVANKQMGPMGNQGEIKRDIEFAKDTQFQ